MPSLEPVAYSDGPIALNGHLARPAGVPGAAVLVFPTIANVTPAIERRSEMLAQAGYLALVADFYGEPVPSFEAAGPLAQRLRADVDGYRARCLAGLEALKNIAPGIPLAAIGYCMGGQAALELARAGGDVACVASFHGILSTERPASPERPIRPRILVCHGDADPMVPREAVLSFWQEMDAAQADWHFHSYSAVKHGFTDPGSDARGIAAIGYDKSADRQSWAALLSFFDEVFGR